MNRLFITFKVEFHPQTNQELLAACAEGAKDRLWDMFDGVEDEGQIPTPSPHDITYELVMEHTDE